MKKIRSNFVKESLLDYANLAKTLKENTELTVRDLLSETVRDTYNQILTEEDDDEYEVEEVKDTDSEPQDDADETPLEDETTVEKESETETDVEPLDKEGEIEDEDSEDEEWAEFNEYKVEGSDDEYDFSGAKDEDVVKVYKLLKDADQVLVNVDKDNNKVELCDNETGVEYLIDLGSNSDADMDAESELEFDNESMNESFIYEVALNEYDSNVGYTDNYQKNDAMTTPSMDEPGKNVNDWDKGLPKGKAKPWAGPIKGKGKPFTEEEVVEEQPLEEEEVMDEGTNVGGFVQQNSTSKSHIPNSNGRKARNSSVAGEKTKGTVNPRYATVTNESKKMIAQVNKILKENEELKKAVINFRNELKEASVVNVSLGQIVKLMMENSTTKEEKQEIIKRFDKNVKTVAEAKELFNTINEELKSKKTVTISEEKQFTANSTKQINETKIYKSDDMLKTLDLMSRMKKY